MLKGRLALLLVVGLVGVMSMAGCSVYQAAAGTDEGAEVSPYPSARDVEIVLHIPDGSGQWLETEIRQVTVKGEPVEELALQMWLEAVEAKNSFLPPRVKASVEVRGGIAYVSFSWEIRDINLEYEGLVVKSLVSTLSEMDEIDRVQILVEGKIVETLGGNSFVGEPMDTDHTVIAKDDYRPIPPSDPRIGEVFIEGMVLRVNLAERVLEIEQHMDSHSPVIDSGIRFMEDVIIHYQDMSGEHREIGFEDIKEGNIVAMILTQDGMARAAIVHD